MRSAEPTKSLGGATQAYWRSLAEICQVLPATAPPVDNSIPGSKALIVTTAPSVRPRTVTPRAAGRPETPRDDRRSNFGDSSSSPTPGIGDVSASDVPSPIVWPP